MEGSRRGRASLLFAARAALHALPDFVLVVDRDLRCEFANRSARAFIERPWSAIRSRPLRELFEPELGVPLEELAVAARQIHRLTTDEIRGPGASSFQIRAEPLIGDSVLLVVRDVTRLRDAERGAAASSEVAQLAHQLTEFQRLARVGTWTWHAVRDVYAVSPELHRLLGTDPSTFRPTLDRFVQMIPLDERDALAIELEALFREQRASAQRELRFVRADGNVRWALLHGEWRYDRGGQPMSAWGTIQDVTEIHLLEEQYRRAQEIEPMGHLTLSVAHDFNNLLTVVRANLDLAIESIPADARVQTELADALGAARRATELVRQLLAFRRNEPLPQRVVDVNELASSLRGLLRHMLGADVQLQLTLLPSLWPVFGDPHQLERVLMNLAVNARDAMPNGGRLLVATSNVSVHELARDRPGLRLGEYVLIIVEDTGHGIDDKVLDRIFEPFFTTKAPGRGTGLGLSTVYGIVKQMGGCVYAETPPTGGARFLVFLPHYKEGRLVTHSH